MLSYGRTRFLGRYPMSKSFGAIFHVGIRVQNFVWNFKGALRNLTQNFEPKHRKMYIQRNVKIWRIMIF